MMNVINRSKNELIISEANKLRWEIGDNLHDSIIESIYMDAEKISGKVVSFIGEKPKFDFDRIVDKIVTSKWTGFPIMFLILAFVFWLTIVGSNYPSGLLASFFVDTIHPILKDYTNIIGLPLFISGVLIDGAYISMAWVVSVMLPPMAISFQ